MIGEKGALGRRVLRTLIGGVLLLTLGACSMMDVFDDDEDKALKPMELADFEPELRIRKDWSTGVGNGQGKLYNRLQPALYGDAIFAASANGSVQSIDATTGKRLWKTDVDTEISGGVGVGGDLVLVGTAKGRVIALDSATGRELWRAQASSEVLARPVRRPERSLLSASTAPDIRRSISALSYFAMISLPSALSFERSFLPAHVPDSPFRGSKTPRWG